MLASVLRRSRMSLRTVNVSSASRLSTTFVLLTWPTLTPAILTSLPWNRPVMSVKRAL